MSEQEHWDFDQETYKGDDLFLLKWEVTDLYDFIWDIPDLSCIRGASKGIDDLVSKFRRSRPTLGTCTVLNSMGRGDHVLLLVRGNAADVEALGKQMVSEAAQKIHCASGFGIVPLNGYGKNGPGLQDAIAECDEQIYRMRLRVLNVDPGLWAHCGDSPTMIRDELDRLRLAEKETNERYEGGRATKLWVSKRTKIRSDNGQDGRWELVQEVARRKGEDYNWSGMKHPFRQDFNSLAANSRPRSGYMAYLTFDGNGFTRLVQQMKTFEELHLFSDFLRDVQFQTLAEVLDLELETLKKMVPGLGTSGPQYEETYQPLQFLYLAGDEGDLVVSGDRGVDVALGLLQRLPHHASELLNTEKYTRLRQSDSDPNRASELRALSYSIGLVICHATTPIRLVRDAAHQLIAGVKAARGRVSDPALKPQIDFMVFESHVTTPDTVQAYRERFIPAQTRRPMTCKDFKKLVDMVRKAKAAGLASSQRHRVVAALVSGGPDPSTRDSNRLLERLTRGLDTTKFSDLTTYLKALLSADNTGRTGFLDFHEIYDWVPNGDKAGGTP